MRACGFFVVAYVAIQAASGATISYTGILASSSDISTTMGIRGWHECGVSRDSGGRIRPVRGRVRGYGEHRNFHRRNVRQSFELRRFPGLPAGRDGEYRRRRLRRRHDVVLAGGGNLYRSSHRRRLHSQCGLRDEWHARRRVHRSHGRRVPDLQWNQLHHAHCQLGAGHHDSHGAGSRTRGTLGLRRRPKHIGRCVPTATSHPASKQLTQRKTTNGGWNETVL